MASSPRDFLAVATPGAGKTTFALTLATELIARGVIDKLTVVCPTEHLKGQWASSAARFGIHIDPDFTNSQGVAGSHFDGVAVTYAQIGSNPAVHAARTRAYRTLVILDEIHHAGDSLSWGDGVREAFTDATRRLALTGTPFRSDTSPIPFVTYEEDEEGIRRSRADYTYGYGDALKDGVVRPVLFMSYSGQMAWRTNAGDEVSARLGEPLTKDMMKQAWRTALDPTGEWISAVLRAADYAWRRCAARCPMRVVSSSPRTRTTRAPTLATCASSPVRHRRSFCPTTRTPLIVSPSLRTPPTSGWLPCVWCPRASTSPAWLSASTRRMHPRPSSSPRRSAATCVRVAAAKPRPSSSPPSCPC